MTQTVLAARDGRTDLAILAGAGLVAAVVALLGVLRGDLPINERMSDWTQDDPPPDWRTWRARWERFFRLRTVATALAFLAAVAGLAALP